MFDAIAEKKIAEAIARGELGDDASVPEDLRLAYRILKNAGFVPPEVDALREVGELLRTAAEARRGRARA